ncbi:MAG: 5'-methylthioadenosine/adenosylhomocysteine nucleosidase [Phycisphaerales bacterium]|nr:MAG: 5'-methylthioadenosine/adenosylhomocysteine nucleosidase [Phycisphaerales bacterium]
MKLPRLAITFMLAICMAFHQGRADEGKKPITGILGAFKDEVEIIESEMKEKEFHTLLGMDFIVGELRDRRVVLAQTGVGKVNAAMTSALLIHQFQPGEVIFTGIAGGINTDLLPGDIVIGEKLAQHDMVIYVEDGFKDYQVRNPLTGQHNPVFLPSDRRLLNLAEKARRGLTLENIVTDQGERTPRITKGVIVTGDAFVASEVKKAELRRRLQADAAEMEGAAVAQICYQQKLPFLVIRSLSNTADSDVDMDTMRFNQVAAHNSARYVIGIVELLATGNLSENVPNTGCSEHVLLQFSLQLDPKIYGQTSYKKPPQFAIWLEQRSPGEIHTVWVTEKTAKRNWGPNISRPVSLPYWASRWKIETQGKYPATPNKPVPDATTGATPREDFHTEIRVPANSTWSYFVEVNVSGDYNAAFPEKGKDGTRDQHGNGQPSIIYQGTITAAHGQTSSPRLIGRTNQWQSVEQTNPDLAGITSAASLISNIKVTCR